MKKYLTASEASKVLKLPPNLVRTLCQNGSFPGSFQPDPKIDWIIPREAIERWLQANQPKPFWERKSFLAFAAVIGVVATILGILGINLPNYVQKQFTEGEFGWRSHEEQIVNSLYPSVDINVFEDLLGKHLLIRTSENGYVEYVFSRKGYWVQAIANREGVVLLYAITVCDPTFTPTIDNLPFNNPIQIGVTTYKQASGAYGYKPHYYISGATANSYLIEELYIGNPGSYQTIFWGYNDACQDDYFKAAFDRFGSDLFDSLVNSNGTPPDPDNPVLNQFRSNSTFNTIAVTEPDLEFTGLDTIMQDYQIGVDRIQIRVFSEKK